MIFTTGYHPRSNVSRFNSAGFRCLFELDEMEISPLTISEVVSLWCGQLLANLRYPRAQWKGCWIQYISGLMWHLISWSIHSWSSHYKPPATAAGNYMFSCFLSPLLPSPLQAAHRQHTIRKLQHQAHLPYVFCFGAYRAGPSVPAMPGHSKSQPFRAKQVTQNAESRQVTSSTK